MYAAVDIGGTKTLVAVFDAGGKVLEEIKFPTPTEYPLFLQALEAAVRELHHKDFKRAAVAAPGRIDRQHGVVTAFGNLPWQNVALKTEAERILGCPVALENDAKLAALSEAQLLKGSFRKVLYVTVSTGIGSGLVLDGELDPEMLDAEVGHMLLEHEGKLQRWEEFASGKAIYNKHGKKVSEIPTEDADMWYEIARNIAIGLINVIASFQPEVIVLGGGVGTHLDKFQDRLLEELKIYEDELTPIPVITKAQHTEEAVIYGCYELARSIHEKAA